MHGAGFPIVRSLFTALRCSSLSPNVQTGVDSSVARALATYTRYTGNTKRAPLLELSGVERCGTTVHRHPVQAHDGNACLLHRDWDEAGLGCTVRHEWASPVYMCVNIGGTKVHVLLVRAASMALGDRRRRAAQDMATGNGCVTGEASLQCGK